MKSVKKTTKITTEGSNTFRAIARAKGKTTTKPLSLSLSHTHTHTQRAHSLTHSLARSFSNAFQAAAAAAAAYTQAHTVISIRERTYYTHPQCPQLLHCALCGTDEASKAATEFP